MTDDQLAEQLHELKRRNETPIPLIEMFDALLSLDPRLSAKQKRKKSTQIMARALERLENARTPDRDPRSGAVALRIEPLAGHPESQRQWPALWPPSTCRISPVTKPADSR